MSKPNPERDSAIVERYVAGESIHDLANAFDVSIARIYQILKVANILRRPQARAITTDDEAAVILAYKNGLTFSQLIDRFKRGSATIARIIHGAGFDVAKQTSLNKSRGFRRYTLNESYFDVVDSERKAWLLGFIAADGNISGRAGSYCLTIHLKQADIAILDTIKSELGYSGPIYRHATTINGRGTYPLVALQIASVRLTDSLKRLGITPKKSLTLTPWDGPADLMPHYWRGIIDGDGHIGHSCGAWQLCLAGSEYITKAFAEYCSIRFDSKATPKQMKNANVWQLHYGGNRLVPKLVEHFYGTATISLPRKLAIARKIS